MVQKRLREGGEFGLVGLTNILAPIFNMLFFKRLFSPNFNVVFLAIGHSLVVGEELLPVRVEGGLHLHLHHLPPHHVDLLPDVRQGPQEDVQGVLQLVHFDHNCQTVFYEVDPPGRLEILTPDGLANASLKTKSPVTEIVFCLT